MINPFLFDPDLAGAKGFVFIGDLLLVYRRDGNTTRFPHYLDLPGGGTESGETPFETFKRELQEEFNLDVSAEQITYCSRYRSIADNNKFGYMFAVHYPAETESQIIFGDEGDEWMLIGIDEFIARDDTWPILKEHAATYKHAQESSLVG